ncbi:MAG: arginine--tRNA ligase [Candidatus Muiribacteriota bacterium]
MQKTISAIEKLIKSKFDTDKAIIKKQKDKSFGDLSVILFPLAAIQKCSPDKIAEIIKPEILKIDEVSKVEFVKGYLNIFISDDKLIDSLWRNINKQSKISPMVNKKVVIDYSSPNIAKPLSIAHLRSTIIGNILSNFLEYRGAEVVRVNHLGDWGTPCGKLIYAVEKWSSWEEVKENSVDTLFKLYVKFHEEAKINPELEKEARNIFGMLEKNNKEFIKKWEKLVKYSISGLKIIYNRLGVKFDKYLGESFYEPYMSETVIRMQEKGLLKKSEGAFIVEFNNMPPCLIKKSDGTSLYALRDITAALYRFEKMQADEIVYVTGNEQSLHFKQIFNIVQKIKPEAKGKMRHVGFGLYRFSDEKMSTRKGNIIFMEDVLDEAYRKAYSIIKKREYKKEKTQKIAQEVGTGAIIFNDNYADRNKDPEFNFNKILDFNGETAPYIQYTAVRIKSILKKAEDYPIEFDKNNPFFKNSDFIKLLKLINDFTSRVDVAIEKMQPYIFTGYLIEVARSFNVFYNKVRVITNNKEQTQANLFFIKCVLQNLERGFSLMGIKIPEKM